MRDAYRAVLAAACLGLVACSDEGPASGGIDASAGETPDDPPGPGGQADAQVYPPGPTEGCDPAFRGPFCSGTVCDDAGDCETVEDNLRIIGLDLPTPEQPTLQEVRDYTVAAINVLRARTCQAPVVRDDCLDRIAEAAFGANGVSHTYFLENCQNAAHDYGRECECNWAQENGGASLGTGRTWVDGVHNPLCRMMTEPYGTGHRANIESRHWKRIGIAGEYENGAAWLHEFGCDASLSSCPKLDDP